MLQVLIFATEPLQELPPSVPQLQQAHFFQSIDLPHICHPILKEERLVVALELPDALEKRLCLRPE